MKILIVILLSKIIEKVHLHENKLKLESIIIKRKIINKTIKKKKVSHNKKKKKIKLDETIIKNISTKNNKKIIIEKQTNVNINEIKNEIKCVSRPSKTNIIKGIFKLLNDTIKAKLTVNSYKKIANTYIKYYKIDQTLNNKRVCANTI